MNTTTEYTGKNQRISAASEASERPVPQKEKAEIDTDKFISAIDNIIDKTLEKTAPWIIILTILYMGGHLISMLK